MSPSRNRPAENLLGVDIGQAQDWTAFAGVTRIPRVKKKKVVVDGVETEVVVRRVDYTSSDTKQVSFEYVDHFELRLLERLPLQSTYASAVDRASAIVNKLPAYSSVVVVDQTGPGRPVVELMEHEALPLCPVTITAGHSINRDVFGWKVPKRILVSNTQVLLQNGRFKVVPKLKLAKNFTSEMMAFRAHKSKAKIDHESFEAREGAHDDMVLAVCLALWWGTHRQTGWLTTPPYPDFDEEGKPHPKAGQPQDIVEEMEDEYMLAARKKYGGRGK